MIERGEDSGLALESLEAVHVGGNRVGQDLQRDVAGQPGVVRAIDLAHATGTQLPNNLEPAKPASRSEAHR